MEIKKLLWSISSLKYLFIFKHYHVRSYIAKVNSLKLNGGKVFAGNKLRIQKGMRLEMANDKSILKIGDNVTIGHNFFLTVGEKVEIGSDCIFSGNVFITSLDHDISNGTNYQNGLIMKKTKIDDGCFIGYNAMILSGSTLGKNCVVGAGSIVKGDFPDNCMLVGSPARIVKIFNNKEGLWESK